DGTLAAAVVGRLRRETTWVPLAKAQSVRLVQGPLQRALGLATVHLDAAGRRVRAEFRERRQEEARSLVGELAALSRSARRQAAQAAAGASGRASGGPAAPAGGARRGGPRGGPRPRGGGGSGPPRAVRCASRTRRCGPDRAPRSGRRGRRW